MAARDTRAGSLALSKCVSRTLLAATEKPDICHPDISVHMCDKREVKSVSQMTTWITGDKPSLSLAATLQLEEL